MYIPKFESIPTERGYKVILQDEGGTFEFDIPVGTTEEPEYEVFDDEEDVMLEDVGEDEYEIVSLINNEYANMYEIIHTGSWSECNTWANCLVALGFEESDYIVRRSCEI